MKFQLTYNSEAESIYKLIVSLFILEVLIDTESYQLSPAASFLDLFKEETVNFIISPWQKVVFWL